MGGIPLSTPSLAFVSLSIRDRYRVDSQRPSFAIAYRFASMLADSLLLLAPCRFRPLRHAIPCLARCASLRRLEDAEA